MAQKEKGPVWVIGAMSGTSMDGVDVAVIETDGIEIAGFGQSRYVPFSDAQAEVLRRALGAWPGEPAVEEAARVVEEAHIAALADLPKGYPVGFHGQTLAHDPSAARTHQAGDGQRLANALSREVVWDFRSADMTLGGQGAPLAPFYHWACARWLGARGPMVFLNLGGVGNLSFVDVTFDAPEMPGACLAFDTGPANAPIDDFLRARGLGDFDEGGALAATGRVDEAVVQAILEEPWFDQPPPKSLDRGAFDVLGDAVANLSDADAAATLVACSAGAVARGLAHLPSAPHEILVTGGGRKNATMMAMLEAATGCVIRSVDDTGLDGDSLEAQAFAYLAVRVIRGLPTSAPGTTGVAAPVGGAQRSMPELGVLGGA